MARSFSRKLLLWVQKGAHFHLWAPKSGRLSSRLARVPCVFLFTERVRGLLPSVGRIEVAICERLLDKGGDNQRRLWVVEGEVGRRIDRALTPQSQLLTRDD